ncbi:MAG: hypothetical protein IJK08_05785 [Prevotella sp.]|nr:hypothetical protein [Prevotella sp.]
MKIVFEDVFVSASAPKSATVIIDRMRCMVGTETLDVYFRRFLKELQEMVAAHNAKSKSELSLEYYESRKGNTDSAKRRTIYLIKKTRGEGAQIARLSATTVHRILAEYEDKLRIFSYEEWDRIKAEQEEGGEV